MTTPLPAPAPTPPSARRKAPLWARALVVLASVVMSLAAAEVVAGFARGHAFPYLNLYIEDAVYGVRLEPDASTNLRSRTGRVTSIRTNARGFRGPDRAPARGAVVPGRVMLLGDSQVMGYGVEEGDALAARLEAELGPGHEVIDAATPTWGPPEYARVTAELVPELRPEVVVFVANVANDWNEARVDNRLRTTARDGWARANIATDEPPTDFPGRRFLLGRSHLVYAVRALFRSSSDHGSEVAMSPARVAADLPWLMRAEPPHRSRLTPALIEVRDTCARWGCRVVVVGLPIDVQVHPAEWDKYRVPGVTPDGPPPDVGGTYRLIGQLMADARDLGLAHLDLLPPLRAASPGAFQVDDYHLSPAGHLAFARALAPIVKDLSR
ncbi:MAG: hypothetical protein IT385_09965 [Deltaproteobacteria bacterium]|nr:hypothetical protein [Deltaproteobacteria bacterium]